MDDLTSHCALSATWLRLVFVRKSGKLITRTSAPSVERYQRNNFVFSSDGPYWLQGDTAPARLRFVEGSAALIAQASASENAWMEGAQNVCSHE